MENLPFFVLIILCHLLFYWKFYRHPFIQSTSELIQNFFPHWKWLGSTKNPFRDDIFYKYPASIPFLSTFYPPHYLSAKISQCLSLDHSFILLNSGIILHGLLSSILSFIMFRQWYSIEISFFGSVLLTYKSYMIKIQQPAIAYTMAWIPGCFVQGWFGLFSFGMCLVTGYYPILIYMIPLIAFNNPLALLGMVIGLIQLIPFINYQKRSVSYRGCKTIPVSEFIRLIFTRNTTSYVNGLISNEVTMYMGIIPIVLLPFATSRMWVPLIAFFIGCIFSNARFLYSFLFALVWLSTNGLENLRLTMIQVTLITSVLIVDLYKNRDVYPSFPFTEWWKKPSEFFSEGLKDSSKFPHGSGYLSGVKGNYRGCLRLSN